MLTHYQMMPIYSKITVEHTRHEVPSTTTQQPRSDSKRSALVINYKSYLICSILFFQIPIIGATIKFPDYKHENYKK